MIHSIYKICNHINEKFYIGYTSLSVDERFSQHIKDSKSEDRNLHRAIRKYGENNFSITVLYESRDEDFCWNIMEPYFIRTTNAIRKGYNMSEGGRGNRITSNMKPVDCYSRDGKFICSYSGVCEAARQNGVLSSRISIACKNAKKNKGSQVKGKWFCYAGEKPYYKIENPYPGLRKALKANTGRRRPEHSKFMKKYNKEKDLQNIYTFLHKKSGLSFVGSRQQLIDAFPEHKIDNIQLGCMIRGLQKTCRGWKLRA